MKRSTFLVSLVTGALATTYAWAFGGPRGDIEAAKPRCGCAECRCPNCNGEECTCATCDCVECGCAA